jgi:hypothetical protein
MKEMFYCIMQQHIIIIIVVVAVDTIIIIIIRTPKHCGAIAFSHRLTSRSGSATDNELCHMFCY